MATITRTSAGRKALVDTYLKTARMTENTPEVDYESYSLIHGILAKALQAGKIVEFFTACVKRFRPQIRAQIKPAGPVLL